jgi:hypothetical protein
VDSVPVIGWGDWAVCAPKPSRTIAGQLKDEPILAATKGIGKNRRGLL